MEREGKIPDKHEETRTIGKVQSVKEKKDKNSPYCPLLGVSVSGGRHSVP